MEKAIDEFRRENGEQRELLNSLSESTCAFRNGGCVLIQLQSAGRTRPDGKTRMTARRRKLYSMPRQYDHLVYLQVTKHL